MPKSERKLPAFLSLLQSFLPFLKNVGRPAAGPEEEKPETAKRARMHRRRHRRHHRRRKRLVTRPQGKTKRDVESLLEQVDLDAMLGTANLELPPAVASSEAEPEPQPAEGLPEPLQVPPAGGKDVEEMLRTVDLDAILGEVKPQQAEEGAQEEQPAEAHPSPPPLTAQEGGKTKSLWQKLAFWRRATPAVPSQPAPKISLPTALHAGAAHPPLPRGSTPAGTSAPGSMEKEEKPGVPVDLDAVLQSARPQAKEEDMKLRGGTFIRKEMPHSPSPGLQPQPPVPPRELTPEEQRKQEELRKRQQEDEKALREQAERRRKEEEEQKKKALEAAKKEQVPTAALPKKRVSLRSRENVFVGIVNALRHFGLGKERFQIIQNLATMLNAGLPLVDSLRTLQMETHNRQARALIQRIVERVESGIPLWRAMQMEHFFTPDALALVRIGEEAGNLAENMQYLAGQQEKDEALRGKVKMAMIYPAIVLVLMVIVIMGLGMFVLPNLISVLSSLNVPLPLVTRLVVGFSNLFSEHGTTVAPATLAALVLLAILVKYTPLQVVFQWFIFRIPGIGALLWEATIARFGVIVGGLLQAGVPLVDALRSLVDVTTILSYQRFYQRLLDHILVGDSFSKSFAAIRGSNKLLPLSVQQLVMTGERTGSLSKVMLKIADIYEKKANETAQKLPVILEPLLLLFIGALVGTIAFAIIVPIYSIVGSVSQ